MLKKITSLATLIILVMALPVSSGEISDEIASREWYDNWSLDSDRDRIDDRLEEEMEKDDHAGEYAIFVDYRSPTTEKDVDYLEYLGLKVDYVCHHMPTIVARNAGYEDVITLAARPEVAMVELDYPMSPLLDASTPAIKARGSSYYSPDTAWELGYTGEGINIAILDTGVDDDHESLQGKFVAGVDLTNEFGPRDGSDNPDDRNGHGTHCAGIAMGTGGSEGTYKGVAPGARLIDVKIGNELTGGSAIMGAMLRGIEWCVDHRDDDWGDDDPTNDGIDVLSISFGGSGSSDGQDSHSRAANNAVEQGIVVLSSVGNNGPDNDGIDSPGAADKVIAVGNLDIKGTVARGDDEIDDSSSRGPREDDGDDDPYDELKPEVSAPGTNTESPTYSLIDQGGNGYSDFGGTSAACPHVSGIVALMRHANPDLTPLEIKDILKETAEARGEPYDENLSEKYNTAYGWGIVDAYKAVKAALGQNPIQEEIEIDITSPADGETLSGNVKIQGTATATGNMTVESVRVKINGEWENVKGIENWYYDWDTRDVENGNHTITAQAAAENGSKEASVSITVLVNNSGEKDKDDNPDDILGLEENEFYLVSGVTICVIAIAAIGFTLRRSRKIRGGTDEEDWE